MRRKERRARGSSGKSGVEVPPMLKAGDVAPSFHAKDHLGRDVSLAALRGKNVVLWFYPKADTPG